MARQSDPLFEPTSSLMETLTLSTDDPAQEDQLQRYQERVEKLPQPDREVEIDIGQYFMTKHTDEFLQFVKTTHQMTRYIKKETWNRV